MRLMSFERNGRTGFGVVVGDGVVDAGKRLAGSPRTLRDALLAGSLPELRRLAAEKPDVALSDVAFAPVIDDPAAKLLCVGVNYMPHIKEMGRERPSHPVLFVRFHDSIVGHGRPLLLPPSSVQFDYEGELAVVIGKRARRVRKEQALDYVAGYACFNDGSIRDFQRHSQQFTPGKNFHHSGSFGPWLVTSDEMPDPRKLTLTTRLNGQVVQHESVERAVLRHSAADRVLLDVGGASTGRRDRDGHARRRRCRPHTTAVDEEWRQRGGRDQRNRRAAQQGRRRGRVIVAR